MNVSQWWLKRFRQRQNHECFYLGERLNPGILGPGVFWWRWERWQGRQLPGCSSSMSLWGPSVSHLWCSWVQMLQSSLPAFWRPYLLSSPSNEKRRQVSFQFDQHCGERGICEWYARVRGRSLLRALSRECGRMDHDRGAEFSGHMLAICLDETGNSKHLGTPRPFHRCPHESSACSSLGCSFAQGRFFQGTLNLSKAGKVSMVFWVSLIMMN